MGKKGKNTPPNVQDLADKVSGFRVNLDDLTQTVMFTQRNHEKRIAELQQTVEPAIERLDQLPGVQRQIDELAAMMANVHQVLGRINPSVISGGDTILDELKSKVSRAFDLLSVDDARIIEIETKLKSWGGDQDGVNYIMDEGMAALDRRVKEIESLLEFGKGAWDQRMENWEEALDAVSHGQRRINEFADVTREMLQRQIAECAQARHITGEGHVPRDQIDALRWDGDSGPPYQWPHNKNPNPHPFVPMNPLTPYDECYECGQTSIATIHVTLPVAKPEPVDHVPLQDSNDAMRWAEEFAALVARKQRELGDGSAFTGFVTDVGWLVGWFANAMQTAIRLHEFHASTDDEGMSRTLDLAMKLLQDVYDRNGGRDVHSWVLAYEACAEQYKDWLGG